MMVIVETPESGWDCVFKEDFTDGMSCKFSALRQLVAISSWHFRVCVSTSDYFHVRTGFIQRRTVRNEGLSGKFVSDRL